MQQQLLLVTNNTNKLIEIKDILDTQISLLTLNDVGITEDIPEPHSTIGENAIAKTVYAFNKVNMNCFGEDTGLEIESLNGKPGVKSARYAGENRNFNANINKVLAEMEGLTHRNARFYTVMALVFRGKLHLFEGICEGSITKEPIGSNGFGYDTIFIPNGDNRTFAEMELHEKQLFSHRQKALKQMIIFYNKANIID
jgi:XTP/dITP diphosphohydrolase